jgi:glycerol-3-phosphate cytidylyltransferase
MVRGITFGTFDLFHIGHVNILRRAREQCDFLIVGVSTDKLNYDKKKVYPVINESERSAIVESCRYVDQVFFEHSLDLKVTYIQEHRADVLFMGDDWAGRFDFC